MVEADKNNEKTDVGIIYFGHTCTSFHRIFSNQQAKNPHYSPAFSIDFIGNKRMVI